jgi:hypothetical protein
VRTVQNQGAHGAPYETSSFSLFQPSGAGDHKGFLTLKPAPCKFKMGLSTADRNAP